MSTLLLPQIKVKGGQDMDGTWGVTKTFTRDFYFELIHVPLPLFMMSSYIPAYNSLHPVYPWAIAKDSKCTKNIETQVGRGITISTNYQILKPAVPFNGVNFTLVDLIAENMPWDLPAQDISYEPVAVEETLDDLYVEKTESEKQAERDHDDDGVLWMDNWKQVPFQTSSGTKLTGTTTRNIFKMSFWYFVNPAGFDEAVLQTQYTNTVNASDVTIAGRFCPRGTVKIESIEVLDNTWERPEVAAVSLKMVKAVLLIDYNSWNKKYENVSNLFMAYPYEWRDTHSGKKNGTFMYDTKTFQPVYNTDVEEVSPQRIFCTTFDPDPQNEGDEDDPIWVSDPVYARQFFGTREDCFRLNPDSEPTEVSEPMYLDENGFVLYPDPITGKVNPELSPKVEGFIYPPIDFSPLRFPMT
jgi:hypothetical protein